MMKFRIARIGLLVGAVALAPPAMAEEISEEGVQIKGMWETLGSNNYTVCLLKDFIPHTDDASERQEAFEDARENCKSAPTEMFAKATMNGGSFPQMFVKQAESVIPPIDAYFLSHIDDFPISDQPLWSDFEVAARLPDGSVIQLFKDDGSEGKEVSIPESYRLIIQERN